MCISTCCFVSKQVVAKLLARVANIVNNDCIHLATPLVTTMSCLQQQETKEPTTRQKRTVASKPTNRRRTRLQTDDARKVQHLCSETV